MIDDEESFKVFAKVFYLNYARKILKTFSEQWKKTKLQFCK